MDFDNSIFRQYDIRGVYGRDFDESFSNLLGLVFGNFILKQAKSETRDRPVVAVGWDARLSSDVLKDSLISGLLSAGVDVLEAGVGPSPQLYFATQLRGLEGGIQVTASHNPPQYNGFKFVLKGQAFYGEQIQRLREDLAAANPLALTAAQPGMLRKTDIRSAYIDELVNLSLPRIGSRKLKVVCDSGNGVGSLVGPEVLESLGCEVISLFTELDGSFPNHPPDPSVYENLTVLAQAVINEKADLGIGWDGDADRIGVLNHRGELVANDMLLLLYADAVLREHPGAVVVADIKCSQVLFTVLREKGAQAVVSRSGHSPIKTKMKELNATLAGDLSGHMFFADRYYGFDDGLYAACRLVEILSNTDESLMQILQQYPRVVATPEIRISCSAQLQEQAVAAVKQRYAHLNQVTLDGVRLEFPHGWALVRGSNTEPALVLRFEAETPQQLAAYRQEIEQVVFEIIGKRSE